MIFMRRRNAQWQESRSTLIPLKMKKLVRSWSLTPKTKNEVTTWNQGGVTNFIMVSEDNLGHTRTLPSFFLIDFHTMEIRRGGWNTHTK